MTIFPISRPALGGFIDRVEVDRSGLIRIVGWFTTEITAPGVWLEGRPVPFLQQYRYPRRDVPAGAFGSAFEYLLPETCVVDSSILEVDFGWEGEGRTRFEEKMRVVNPHHRGLLNSGSVLHREHIYGPGPPNIAIHPDILEMAKQLKGPVLDFGCGRGLLVEALREGGIEAHGLELDSPVIRQCAPPDVTLYDGSFPSPMERGRFASVICSEVLEHIPDYVGAVREIVRLAGDQALFTVPDASAIPLGYQYGAVPWHLLESTHVNFFTQQSLQQILKPYFPEIEFGRVGSAYFGETPYYVSLTALCWK
jgi:hypothetical protein